MSVATFDPSPAFYAGAEPNNSPFAPASAIERLQRRKPANLKTPLMLTGVLLLAGVGAFAVSELLGSDAQTQPVNAAVSAVAPPAIDAAPNWAPVNTAAVSDIAPVAATPTTAVRQAAAPTVTGPAVRPAPRIEAGPAPAVSVAIAPTAQAAPPPVLALPPATDAPAPTVTPAPFNPDTGAAVQ